MASFVSGLFGAAVDAAADVLSGAMRRPVAATATVAAVALALQYRRNKSFDAEYIFPQVEKKAEGGGGGGGEGDEGDDLVEFLKASGDDVTVETVPKMNEAMRHSFLRGTSRPFVKRMEQLKKMLKMIDENEDAIIKALGDDLGRPKAEAILYDILVTRGEIKHLISSLRKGLRPEPVSDTLLTFPSSSYLYKEPYGTVLVIGTWNYPFMLTLVPLAGAIAAGNTVVVKPSLVSRNCAETVANLVHKYLDPEIVRVVGHTHERDRMMISALIEERWDYVFFTGGPTVGRIVMQKVAKHLTPCTLELGGKNPVFVASDADIDLAAKRTMWGRMMNAGQQCIAPDYVLVDKKVADRFLERCKTWIGNFYEGKPETPGVIGRLVNQGRMNEMKRIMDTHGGEVVIGGTYDMDAKYMEPTILKLDKSSPVLEDETFGPILMVVPVDGMDEACRFVNGKEKPLSMYIFASSNKVQERILQNTSAGGVTINGTLWHVGHPKLPFGGVGRSGMGAYHGKYTLDTFCHKKPVCRKSVWYDFGLLSDPFFVYPPWTDSKISLARKLIGLA